MPLNLWLQGGNLDNFGSPFELIELVLIGLLLLVLLRKFLYLVESDELRAGGQKLANFERTCEFGKVAKNYNRRLVKNTVWWFSVEHRLIWWEMVHSKLRKQLENYRIHFEFKIWKFGKQLMKNINGVILSLFVLIKLIAKLLKQTANKFSKLYKIYILKDEFTIQVKKMVQR